MTCYDNVITVYHCNYKNKLTSFISRGKICISKDKHYLGDGMYFWEKISDLEFWEKEKIRKFKRSNKQTEVLLSIKAQLSYNKSQILDLTDNSEFEKLKKIKELLNKANQAQGLRSTDNLGEIINRIFNSRDSRLQNIVSNITVLKINIKYNNLNNQKEKTIHSYSERLPKNQQISVDIRTIYCVKKQHSIQFLDIIKEEVL